MKLFEKLEKELVDEHYKNFEILELPKKLVIANLLKGFGDLEIQLNQAEGEYFDKSMHFYHCFLELQNCLKWVIDFQQNQITELSSQLKFNDLEKMIGEYMRWGMDYNKLVDWHTSKWRGYSDIEIDEKKKVVKFKPKISKGIYYFTLQQRLVSTL